VSIASNGAEAAEGDPSRPIQVLPEQLSADALAALVESFILREGTDYGLHEVALETKKNQVLRSLEKKEVLILFDPESESINLLTAQAARALLGDPR